MLKGGLNRITKVTRALAGWPAKIQSGPADPVRTGSQDLPPAGDFLPVRLKESFVQTSNGWNTITATAVALPLGTAFAAVSVPAAARSADPEANLVILMRCRAVATLQSSSRHFQ